MSGVRVVKTSMTLAVTLPDKILHDHTGYVPSRMGQQLAEQVCGYVHAHNTGYFPPLDYFEQGEGIEADLITLAQQMTQFSGQYLKRDLYRHLVDIFSNLKVVKIQSMALTMPKVRVNEKEAKAKLAKHFSPARMRVELELSTIEKAGMEGGIELARHKVLRWLHPHYAEIEVTEAHDL